MAPTRAGVGVCSRAGCTRRRPNTRPGFPRLRTRPSSWNSPSRRRRPPLRSCCMTPGFGRGGRRAEGASLERLRALLRTEGGLMASLVELPRLGHREHCHDPSPGPAQLAASGPRASGNEQDYELLVETIYEGYLLHYGASSVVRPSEEDLGLLAGDRLYASGLGAAGRAGRHRGGGGAGRHDRFERARARRGGARIGRRGLDGRRSSGRLGGQRGL